MHASGAACITTFQASRGWSLDATSRSMTSDTPFDRSTDEISEQTEDFLRYFSLQGLSWGTRSRDSLKSMRSPRWKNGSERTLTEELAACYRDNVIECYRPVCLVRCWLVIPAKAIRRSPRVRALRPFPALSFLLRFAFDAITFRACRSATLP